MTQRCDQENAIQFHLVNPNLPAKGFVVRIYKLGRSPDQKQAIARLPQTALTSISPSRSPGNTNFYRFLSAVIFFILSLWLPAILFCEALMISNPINACPVANMPNITNDRTG